MLKRTKRISIALLLSAGILSGCGAEEATQEVPAPTSSKEEIKEEPVQETMTDVEETITYPLTGMKADDEGELSQRVIGVMINNHPKARPQSGIHKADVVYEVLAEGFVTRFLALYHSEQPDIIGPVRSARDYYIHLNNGFDAIYVCHGFSPEAQVMLNKQNVADDLNGLYYDGSLFHRASFRSAPHNSYITYEKILQGAEKNEYALTQDVKPYPFLTKAELESLNGESVNEVMVTYSDYNTVSYTYVEGAQKYERYSNGEKTVDRESKTPVQVENIFIVEAPHRVIDNEGRREIDLKAGGQAYLLQHGMLQKVTWRNVDGRILPYKDDKPVGFVPGKTWINLIPQSPGLNGAVSTQSK